MTAPARTGAGLKRKRLLPQDLLLTGLIAVFMLLSFQSSRQESATIDEFRHLSTGVYYWQSRDFSFDSATPPLWKMAIALPAYLGGAKPVRFSPVPDQYKGSEPWFVATDFMRDNAADYAGYLAGARLVNILAACCCLVILYRRAGRRFGASAALYGVSVLAFSPTLLAHSHYATTDVISAATLLVTVFMLLDYFRLPSWQRLTAATALFAVSLLCKFTALLLLPLFLLAPLAVVRPRDGGATAVSAGIRLSHHLLGYGRDLLLMLLTVLLLINLAYGFRGTGASLAGMAIESKTLAALRQTVVGSLPLPFPRAFVEGFDRQKADSDYAEFPSYFLGRWSADGFRSYYLGAFCLKETIPFLIVVAASLGALGYRSREGMSPGEALVLLYLPMTLFIVLSFMNKLNLGIRYLLPAYPFLAFFSCRLYALLSARRGFKLLLSGLALLNVFFASRVAPHYISYFNELAGGPANGQNYLIDSNIDWGQDLPALKEYLTQHGIGRVQLAYFGHALPEFYGIDHEPLSIPAKPGYAAVSVSLLIGQPYLLTYADPPQVVEGDRFRDFRGLTPAGRAGYSIMIYKID